MISRRTIAEVLVAAAVAVTWYVTLPKPAPIGEYRPAESSPDVKGVPTVPIKPKQVVALDPGAKKKLGLAEDVQNDPNKWVLGTAKLPADTHPQTVVAILDEKTGKTSLDYRRDELPWLAAEQTGYARIGYGVRSGAGRVTRLEAGETLLAVKALHFGVNGSLDSDGMAYVGAFVEWRW